MTMPPRARLAAILWIALAAAIWNVVFDRVVVLAGRRYVAAAAVSAKSGVYLRIDDAMKPAVAHGVRLASAVAIPVAALGVGLVLAACRRSTVPKP